MSSQALIIGATGLCGSAFVKYAAKDPSLKEVLTISRRGLNDNYGGNIRSLVLEDSTAWPAAIPENFDVLFSGLATTRGEAGKENFHKVDYDMNLQLAKSAKEKGYSTYVLVSSTGANANSMFYYMKTKGELERDILALGFERTIILRPGPLLGERKKSKGFLNDLSSKIGSVVYRTRFQSFFGSPVYGEEVGKVGVRLALDASNTAKVKIVESAEILRLAEE
ncbi:LAQU0S08e00188g1_1 [Lachancea quebecensis]|uniref:Protein FMP52, mitochondrial n=1 Tax=Lachancea quebecensis TaxID=1654605 RepID=A0A0P1KS27_9SACH|nr:LAQU0S08e00188g1_1 [Lachancea quebecensis]